jgi:pimeloyl-ACP methyl ester carboxylesterase
MDLVWLILVPLALILFMVLISAVVLLVNKQRLPPACEFVDVGGTKLHYCQKGSGPPVILLHGSNGSFVDFRLSIMDELSKDFWVIAFDRPGHGFSQGDPGGRRAVRCMGIWCARPGRN